MAISRIAGQMLQANLERDGNSLAVINTANSIPILYLDVTNSLVGINTPAPTTALHVVGNILANNLSTTGNVDSGNVLTTGLMSATSNITGGNVLTTGLMSATGTITSSANITGGNLLTSGQVSATGNVTGNYILGNGSQLTGLPATYSNANVATFLANFGSNSISTTGNITSGNSVSGNLTFSSTTISTNLSNGNINLTATGTGLVQISGNSGIVIPTGNTAQRPTGNTTGTFRYNNILNQLEYNNGSAWIQVGSGGSGNVIVIDQQITPDGTNATYTLTQTTTQAGILVSINGISQLPSVSYTVTGNAITFTETPTTTDIIDIRFLAAASSQNQIFNSNANTLVQTQDGGNITFTSSNSTIGNINANGLYLSGIVLATGNITGANIVTGGLISAAGNIYGGNLSVSGNVIGNFTLDSGVSATGNITGGNVLTSGLISATSTITSAANIAGGNLTTGGQVTATANITGGNLLTSGQLISTKTGTATTGDGQLYLNGSTNNRIDYAAIGLGDPTTSSRSVGTKIVLWPQVDSSGVDYAIGLTSGVLWNSVHDETKTFKWFANTIAVATLTGTGNLTVTGNIASNNISVTGGVTAASVAGGVITGTSLSATGNITGGNLSAGNGTITVGNIVTTGNISGNIGSATNTFNTVFAKATTAQYADIAEMYAADNNYAPGTVLTVGGSQEVTLSIQDADPRIAGIVSENPAYRMNAGLVCAYPVAVALTGRVKCLVQGTVVPGDMMVSAGNGRARAESNPAMGTVIGKALKASTQDLDIIEVIVGRL